MNTKHILYLAAALALTACSDWLDTNSESLSDEKAVWENPAQTALAVNGLYSDLCGNNYTQIMTIHMAAGTDVELIDGLGSNATAANERGAMNYNAGAGDWNKLGTLWEEQYQVVRDCNRIVDGVEASDAYATGSQANKLLQGRYLDEAKTIRAMVYLDLVRVFGDVPLMLHKPLADLSNVNVPKTGRDDILDSLIVDLEGVCQAQRLPKIGDVTSEHITLGYAEALLANIYMTRAGYAVREAKDPGYNDDFCAEALMAKGYVKADYSDDVYPTLRPSDDDCTALYNHAKQHLANVVAGLDGNYQLYPTFAQLWNDVNQLKNDATYHENMFEIPMGFGNTGELGYTVGVRLNGTTVDWGYSNSSGKLKTTAVQLYAYAPRDTRRDITCANFEIKDIADREQADGTKKTTTVESRLSNKPFGLYIAKWDVRKMSPQWALQNKTATAKFGYGINPIRMRYAQVLLWYAECIARTEGVTQQAHDLLKQVHNRAYNDVANDNGELAAYAAKIDAITSADDFIKAISDENRLEFCGEGYRKWDLIRWNTLHQAIWKAKTEYAKGVAEHRFVMKVYYKYLDVNQTKIDWSSALWYGATTNPAANANTTKNKTEADNDWLSANGYYTKDDAIGVGGTGYNADTYNGTAFGTEYGTAADLPSICSGLVGNQKVKDGTEQCQDQGINVKNRYLMPIYTNVLNSTNGRVRNNYGF